MDGDMRWEILHRTRYQYATPARDSFNQVRLHPLNTKTQTVESFRLNVTPPTHLQQFRDYYGNLIHEFEVPEPHDSLLIESTVRALTLSPAPLADDARPFPLERMSQASQSVDCYEFLNASHYVDVGPATAQLTADATKGATDAWQAALAIMRFVHRTIAYVAKATSVHTHMREVLAQRQGVCQDFAHVALGLCRAAKIPALYASGYWATERASATHAWVEVYIPEIGWRGLDPTHDRQVDETYLKIAVGRDYEDVAPVTGRYRGPLERKMEVEVYIEAKS
jgi:transglutaminase-like putative cysteine protease